MVEQTSLRADAQRNRERILEAAEALFLEKGAGASLDDVAKHAGVGIGTLYRRFATREDLLAATYNARLLAMAEASKARDAYVEPIESLRAYLEDLVINTSTYRGLATSLGTVLQIGTPGCAAVSVEGQRQLRRALDAGAVRDGISFDDMVCVATAVSLSVEQDGGDASRVGRLIDLFLTGLRA